MFGFAAQSMAQDVKSQINAISKVVAANKNNPKAAEAQVKEYLKLNKKNAEALVGLGRAYLEIKDTANAKKYAEQAMKVNKKSGDACVLLGDIEVLKDNGGAAAGWYQQATMVDPQNPQGYIGYARIYQKADPQGAVQMLEKLRTIRPDYPVDAEAAHFFYRASKFQESFDYYSKVSTSKLDKSQLLEYISVAYVLGKNQNCVDLALEGINKYPDTWGFPRFASYNYLALKDYDKAIEYAEKTLKITPDTAVIFNDYNFTAQAYLGKKDYKNAVVYLQKAYDKDNSKTALLKQMAEAYTGAGDFDNAVEMYNKYIANVKEPKYSDYTTLAEIYTEKASKLTGAAQEQALLKADAVYADAAKATQDDGVKAYLLYTRAGIHANLDPDTKKGLAKPYYEQLATLAASKDVTKGNWAAYLKTAYRYLAIYNYFQNNKDAAVSYAQKLLALDPTNETAKQIVEN